MAQIKLLFTVFFQSMTSFFFLLIVVLVYMYIKKNAQVEEYWLGFLRNSINERLMETLLYGIIVGLLASSIILFFGIVVDYKAVIFIWPLALVLMLFNQRYLCFSYAAGILSMISLLTGWPSIDVSSIIALVGILHLMESILIYVDGYRDSLPVFMKHEKFKAVGAHIMKKIWPIPLVVLVIPAEVPDALAEGIAMPDWWPVFRPQVQTEVLVLLPIVAALGYSDIAITNLPRDRARKSGLLLCIYSLSVLAMAIASSNILWLKYISAIYTPLVHEFIIIYGKRSQMNGTPVFDIPWRGLRVLEVFPGSPGEKMGIKAGDILLNINGKGINSGEMLYECLRDYPSFVWVDVKRNDRILTFEYRDYQKGIGELGIMFVPRQTGKFFSVDEQKGIIFRWCHRLLKRSDKGVETERK